MDIEMKTLANLEPYDAFRLALEMSGKSEKEVAEEMEYKPQNCHRIFATEDYYTSYEKIPQLCKVLGNNIIIMWLIAQADKALDEPSYEKVDCPALLKDAAELFKKTSAVGKEASEAIGDNKLEPHELRKVIKNLNAVQDTVFTMIGKLRQTERKLVQLVKEART